MSEELAIHGGETALRIRELEPVDYLETIRLYLHENGAYALRNPVTQQVGAAAEREEAASQAFILEECSSWDDRPIHPTERQWIADGFSTVMGRLVKVTAKASAEVDEVPAFAGLDAETQRSVREQVLYEYMELSAMFVKEGRAPSKTTYRMSPVLYHGPQDLERIGEENADLGRYAVIRAIRHHPIGVETYMERVREEITKAAERFPAIPRSEICNQVLYAPDSYERHLRRYAEKRGLRLDAGETALPEVDDFLGTFRELLRSRQYNLSRLKPPAEVAETASRLGQEALLTADISSEPLDPKLREAFRKRVELLVLASNQAWRYGDLDATPERTPEGFRRALYSQVLGDLMTIHADVKGHSDADRLTLLHDPAEVRRVVADNPDLPAYIWVHMLLHDPEHVDQAIAEYRERFAAAAQANPRLNERDISRLALFNSDVGSLQEAPTGEDTCTPAELLQEVRDYLGIHINVINAVTKRSKAEVERLIPEAKAFFETLGWTFGGTELPEGARPTLLKKVEEFITANERAYRDGEITTRLEDFSDAERHEVYGAFGANYTGILETLGIDGATAWRKAPVLYIDATELRGLRTEHAWLRAGDFRTIAVKNPNSIGMALQRAKEARDLLKLTYPGLTDALVNELVVKSPITAPQNAIAHVRKQTEWEFDRGSDLIAEPTGKDTRKLYKHLKVLAKFNRTPKHHSFDEETETKISSLHDRAAAWMQAQPESGQIDERQMSKILSQLEHYVRISETLDREGSYPSILGLPPKSQNVFMRYVYTNQVELNNLVASQTNGNRRFRTYSFGFFHDADYLAKLWKQYDAYMPANLITFGALMSPRRPMDRLNELVEYRASMLRENPRLDPDELNKATFAALQRS